MTSLDDRLAAAICCADPAQAKLHLARVRGEVNRAQRTTLPDLPDTLRKAVKKGPDARP